MKYVKWLFVVTLLSSLFAFVEKDKPTGGLSVGDVAPDINIETTSLTGMPPKTFKLSAEKGKYVLLSFWASYDAQSRMQNVSLNNVLRNAGDNRVKMVSVSFDEFRSIYDETLRNDQIVASVCSWQTKGVKSDVYQTYRLGRGLINYLIDGNGIIIAKNINAANLSAYLKTLKA
jgi:thiol-disulfide isomerase/thioredoxin